MKLKKVQLVLILTRGRAFCLRKCKLFIQQGDFSITWTVLPHWNKCTSTVCKTPPQKIKSFLAVKLFWVWINGELITVIRRISDTKIIVAALSWKIKYGKCFATLCALFAVCFYQGADQEGFLFFHSKTTLVALNFKMSLGLLFCNWFHITNLFLNFHRK